MGTQREDHMSRHLKNKEDFTLINSFQKLRAESNGGYLAPEFPNFVCISKPNESGAAESSNCLLIDDLEDDAQRNPINIPLQIWP